MELNGYYRSSTMDIYGSEHPIGYYHTNYPMGMADGGGEATAYNGWSTGASSERYGTSHWYARDAGTSVPWNPTVSNSGYDPRMMPSPWTYEWGHNQQLADGMTHHQQMSGIYAQNESLLLPVAPESDGGYITPENSVDYQEMAGVTLDSDGLPMVYSHIVKSEPTIFKSELGTMEYAAPTPPLSPYECVQFDHSALVAQTNEPPAQSEAPVLFEVKIMSDVTHSFDESKDQEVQQQDRQQQQDNTPKSLKPKPPRTKQPRKSQLQTQWNCEECNKCFIRRLGLVQHNAIKHAGDRPFCCNKCGKRFADAELLDKHIHRHQSMDKPFKCALCPKQFYYRMDLIRHDYKHTGNSPHVCSYCSKSFSRQDHLRRHEFIHERESGENERHSPTNYNS
uniref:C2H2-type domain-containing protein n=1 Tax=Anopheles atroparvus TaxID=41427 RepID=A0A182JEV4_ANOAO